MSIERPGASMEREIRIPPPQNLNDLNLSLVRTYTDSERRVFFRSWEKAIQRAEPVIPDIRGTGKVSEERIKPKLNYPEEYRVLGIEEQLEVFLRPEASLAEDASASEKIYGVGLLDNDDMSFGEGYCLEQAKRLREWMRRSNVFELYGTGNEPEKIRRSLKDPQRPNQKFIDGLFVIPKISAIATSIRLKDPTMKGTDYELALRYILKKLYKTRGALGQVTTGDIDLDSTEHYVLHPRTAFALAKLESETTGSFFVIPAQTGMVRVSETARYSIDTLDEYKTADGNRICEYGLDLYAAACILLTHPERFRIPDPNSKIRHPNNIGMKIIGQQLYFPSNGSRCSAVFNCGLDIYRRLFFTYVSNFECNIRYGSATGFLPVESSNIDS